MSHVDQMHSRSDAAREVYVQSAAALATRP